jgi:hypothetical protein
VLLSDYLEYSVPPFHPGESFPKLATDQIDAKNRPVPPIEKVVYFLSDVNRILERTLARKE